MTSNPGAPDNRADATTLERAEEAALPTFRPELPTDIDAIAEVLRAAFNGPAEAELVDAIRRSAHYLPDLSIVAEMNGQVVGHVLLSRVDLVTTGGEALPFLALAPVGVLPMHQGRGIGTLLMRAGLALAHARGNELGVAVLGSPNFYGRFGFRAAEEAGIDGPWPVAPGVFQVLRLDPERRLPAGTVNYPAAFSHV